MNALQPQDRLRQRRLYGRRRGRALRQGQRELLATMLPRLRVSLSERGKLDPRTIFPATIGHVWLEIGFGAGEHLIWQAEHHPKVGVIGCEVFEPGIARLLAEVKSRDLASVRVFDDDARVLIAALAPRSLARVFILFPDPWPKERHKKRRIVATETLDDLAAAMSDGAELRIATDDPDYGQWIEERLAGHPAFEAAGEAARPSDWPATRYEKKAESQGRRGQLFRYRRRLRSTA